MFELFSTREIATGIYLVLLLIWLLTKQDGSKALFNLAKAVFKKVIIIPLFCLLGYATLLVCVLHHFPFWEWILLKDVVLWVFFVATPICFRAGTRKIKEYPFRRMVTDNFLGSAILEFFVGAFTFSLWVELLVLPMLTLIAMLKDYDRQNVKYIQYQKVFDGIAVLAGLVLLFFTAKEAIITITKEGTVSLLVSFSIPVVFSVAFLPVVYILALKAMYHDLFVRLYIRNHISKDGLGRKKRAVFCACGLSYRKLQRFVQSYSRYISVICSANDDESFYELINQFKKNSEEEWNPRLVIK